MSIFRISVEKLNVLKAYRQEFLTECDTKFKDFKNNTLGLKLDEDSKEYYGDKDYLKELFAKIPSDFKARLEDTLKPFMQKNDKEWLDIFRFYAFVCFEGGDNVRILADIYNEGGLDINFYNGVIKEPDIKAYQALFKVLEFLSIEELCALKNIVENSYFNEDEILNEFFKYEDFLYAFLIWRDIVNEAHFSIIYEESYNYPFDFLSSEEIFENLNEKLEKNGAKENSCFFVEKGFYARKNLIIREIEELFEDADFSLLNDGKDRLEFLIKKISAN
ncbi:hypothetical protein [Campylobacter upsaliensis]|uniref:Uncharacterized protein n=1 Tax=Campylobacter upsaliensis TaxID=28080 RepID=A0A381F3L9_CAMUP|nr:hypothetical protein [Campylobacter upsaliensis]EAL52591.1 hypothetical protein CUPA0139 [Campylobacter upsaliensis RM3195]MCR2120797.1 hypothetical protein [Campylobacter upsaliensis]SUX41160.1 Uncharacterised protein [Campylobacter upsaliensis]